MKLKFYMRGVGIGVVITTIILVIAFALTGNNLSDEEIIARAKKLGMVESNTTTNSTIGSAINSTKANSTESNSTGNQTIEGATGAMPESTANTLNNNTATAGDGEYVEFTIDQGEVSRTVIDKLVAAGIVSDAYTFNKFLNDKGVDNNLQPGTFRIKKGISEDELATLLATKQQFRE